MIRGRGRWDGTGGGERVKGSLEVSPNQVDEIFGQFGRDLLPGAVGEVKTDMRLEDFAHERIDAATHRGEEHQLVSAIGVGGEGALNGVELAAQLANPLHHFDGFALVVGHGTPWEF